MAMRTGTAQVSPTASLVSSITSLQQAGAVFERAAIFIGALIGGARQELLENAEPMAGIDIDEIVAGVLGAQGGGAMGAAQIADVGLVHGARLDRIVIDSSRRSSPIAAIGASRE